MPTNKNAGSYSRRIEIMRCADCFDKHLTAELLAETCQVTASEEHTPRGGYIRLEFICRHKRVQGHRSYPGCADWSFARSVVQAGICKPGIAAA
jgi:hypothetical protein